MIHSVYFVCELFPIPEILFFFIFFKGHVERRILYLCTLLVTMFGIGFIVRLLLGPFLILIFSLLSLEGDWLIWLSVVLRLIFQVSISIVYVLWLNRVFVSSKAVNGEG